MADHYEAGGSDTLGIVRHGRELMQLEERVATTADIFPGMVVEKTTDSNGNAAFQPHTGDVPENEVFVAVEARGRGMSATTDTGYVADDDFVKAMKASGGGVHLLLSDGENVSNGDALVVDSSNNGQLAAYDSGTDSVDDILAYTDEDLDLSGAGDSALVQAEMEGGN